MNAPLNLTNTTSPFDKWFADHPTLKTSLMMHLYNRLDGAYPHWWRANFPTQQAIDNWAVSWAEAFEEAGITPADIKGGLKVCRVKYDKPPSSAEFIKACKPSVDPLVSYYEAVAGVQARAKGEVGAWSHPAVYWAAMPLAFDLGNQTYSQIKPRWERALAEQMGRGEWPAIPAPMVALPAPGKSMLSSENAAKMVSALKADGVIKTDASKSDGKLWARRIMARIKRGDKTVTMIQRNSAEEALALTPAPQPGA